MKEAYYFSHDSNARHDPKITAMRSVYGSEGYGWYWMLVEMMRESEGYRLDMQGKYTWNAFASQLQTDSIRIAEFVHDCISEFELFESDGEYFWSASLNRRMELRDQKSEVRRKAAKARWDKEKKGSTAEVDNATSMHLHSNSTANAMQGKESKRKESKGKEIKEEEIGPSSSSDEPFYSEIGVVDAYNQIYKTFTMPSVWSIYIRDLKKRGITDERIISCLWHAAESSDNGKPGVNYFKPVMERWIKEGIYTAEESKQRREAVAVGQHQRTTQGHAGTSAKEDQYAYLDRNDGKWSMPERDPTIL
ncbi:DUF4373 domain-containing protein [Paenibacillus wenxiniae]|uniref:DUF4373 domain-containing protein n=1 Tax=Paenibacillus wenxiniae TaxID=1636843 RepID=A0ABW4RCM5_9BACL